MGSGSLSINSNIVSLKAQRHLATATNALTSSFRNLSSGLRINSASDDAAGLAVASSLKADVRLYSQGVRNLNDGISALNIADGTLSNLSSVLTRLQELAEQAANGTLNAKQRKSLDDEAQALAQEFFRIAHTTSFNGLNLFDGTVQGVSLQAGYGINGTILSSLGGALGTGTFGAAVSYDTEGPAFFAMSSELVMTDVNGDGLADMITAGRSGDAPLTFQGYATVRLGNGDGSFMAGVSYETESTYSSGLALGDVNGDGIPDLVTSGTGDDSCGYVTLRIGAGDGTFGAAYSYQSLGVMSDVVLGDVNSDGILDLASAEYDGAGYATIRLGTGDGTFRSVLTYLTEADSTSTLRMFDVNGDDALDLVSTGSAGGMGYATIRLGHGDGTFGSALSYETSAGGYRGLDMADLNGDNHLDLVVAGDNGGGLGYAYIRAGNGDGTFRSMVSYTTNLTSSAAVALADLDGDGKKDLITAGAGFAYIRLGNGDGNFGPFRSYATEPTTTNALSISDVNGDGVFDLVTAGSKVGTGGFATVRLADTRDGISPILPFSLRTIADARQAIPMLKHTAERLLLQQGQIGAFQSRLASALNTLQTTVIQYSNAESRIMDVDVAEESSALARNQILQQVGASVLAQANNTPSIALMLLKR